MIQKCLLDGYRHIGKDRGNKRIYIKKVKRLKNLEKFMHELKCIDLFEQRFSKESGDFYLYVRAYVD